MLALETMRILFGGKETNTHKEINAERELTTQVQENVLREGEFPDYRLDESQIKIYRQALAKAVFKGRMEEVREGVYLDGAHNLNAIIGFTESISNDPSTKIIVFGAVVDKDVEAMTRELVAGLETSFLEMIIVTKVTGGRAIECGKLKMIFEKYTDKPVLIVENPHEALDYAIKHQGNSKIYCLGSLYLIGEIRKKFAGKADSPLPSGESRLPGHSRKGERRC
jgi:folylpolyglutamate synthase/dihydropteroate synthase